jgi:hypothetical protein
MGSVTIEEFDELQDDYEILRRKVRLLEDSQTTDMKKHQVCTALLCSALLHTHPLCA